MAWNNAGEIIVAGTGQLYTAPEGTTLPTNAGTALNAAFKGLGYHTEDGVTVTSTPEVQEFNAWQSRQPVRIERQTDAFSLSAVLMQWDEDSLVTAFGGGSVVDQGGGMYRYNPPQDTDALSEKAYVLDAIDGDRITRFVVPRGVVTEATESQFSRTATANLPVNIRALAPDDGSTPWFALFDNDAFAAGS